MDNDKKDRLEQSFEAISRWIIAAVLAAMFCGWYKVSASLTWLQFAAAFGCMLLVNAALEVGRVVVRACRSPRSTVEN